MDAALDPGIAGSAVWGFARETFSDEVPVEVGRPRSFRERYELGRRLGRGASSDVWLADDHQIGRKVAIKRFRVTPRHDLVHARFRREVQILGRLEHPNIVPVHDVGVDAEGPYLVMRLAHGQTLERLIARLRAGDPEAHARFPFEARARIAESVLRALAYAHDQKVVHRDIKPANVMIGQGGEVQLLDWGVARDITHFSPEAAIVGSPAYMAPEQAEGRGADARSDVYAVGVLLHELLTLEHYLADVDTLEDALSEARRRPVPFAGRFENPHQPPVPVELARVVERATQRDVRERYQSAADFADDLQRVVEGHFAATCPVTWQKWSLRRLGELVDRHPAALPATVAVHSFALGSMACALAWLVL